MGARVLRCVLLYALVPAFVLAPSVAASAGDGDIVMYAKNATVMHGAWSLVADDSAAGGMRMANPNAGKAKITTAAADPASYFELTFTPAAGRAYRLWVRGKAENDSYQNDSAFVQFSGSLASDGSPAFRIGTTDATWVGIEQGAGKGLSGWGWSDNGYDAVGTPIYFDGAPQTIRIQQREDGLSLDQIVLSPVTYWTAAPGAPKNDNTILPLPLPTNGDIVLYAKDAASVHGAWSVVDDATAAGGARMANPNAGKWKLATASASPASYFELTFTAAAGVPYRLWLRGKAEDDSYQNDSAFVQFSGSLTADGQAAFRVGTTDATWVGIEQGSGKGLSGWGWSDNGYDSDGTPIYFDGTRQTIRIQQREDGLSIDQIVLSPVQYFKDAPGTAKNDTTILQEQDSDGSLPPPPLTDPPVTQTAPPPPPDPSQLRLLQWNTHHGGYGTDGKYDTDRLATWIVKFNPDVVMLNEIEKYDGWGNQDQPEIYKALLEAKTGKTWYYLFTEVYGQWTSPGEGNLILSTVPFTYTNRKALGNARAVGEVRITWNGRPITLFGTHLDNTDASVRLSQMQKVMAFAAPEPENKIIAGDMNASGSDACLLAVETAYTDTWAAAKSAGTAVSFAGNNGETKNTRIDYIFLSKTAADLSIASAQVFDTRDANGVMPSDHRPLLTTFIVH